MLYDPNVSGRVHTIKHRNFIVNDYKQHGENSILARVLKALNG